MYDLRVLGFSIALALAATPALAGEAQCFSTDDGYYDCWFEPFNGDGSFEISAPGKPTFTLNIDTPGVAYVGAQFEPNGRQVLLPGDFLRSKVDPACWQSNATATQICAW